MRENSLRIIPSPDQETMDRICGTDSESSVKTAQAQAAQVTSSSSQQQSDGSSSSGDPIPAGKVREG
ncbi:hypothetical protein AB3S75_013173 [Citrus x aurantiifolia]